MKIKCVKSRCVLILILHRSTASSRSNTMAFNLFYVSYDLILCVSTASKILFNSSSRFLHPDTTPASSDNGYWFFFIPTAMEKEKGIRGAIMSPSLEKGERGFLFDFSWQLGI